MTTFVMQSTQRPYLSSLLLFSTVRFVGHGWSKKHVKHIQNANLPDTRLNGSRVMHCFVIDTY